MRIISGFKDYYDSAQCYGSDPNLLFVRETEIYEFESRYSVHEDRKTRMPRGLDQALAQPIERIKRLPHSLTRHIRRWENDGLKIPITVKLIGFCGFVYPAIGIDGKTFYSTHEIVSGLTSTFLKRCGTNKDLLIAALERKEIAHYRWHWRRESLTHDSWSTAVSELKNRRFDAVFIDLGVPAFKVEYIAMNESDSVDRIRCTLSPYLKEDEFQKVKGPAEAFQEISMYLGNQLACQPDPVSNIPDEVLRDEKGFDEWSFRRHKEEDKKYKKNLRTKRR
jgi:hypothetical protein